MQPLDSTIRGGSEEAPATGCIHRGRAQPYQFRRDAPDPFCAILYRPVLRRAAYIALTVGTILTIINQGDVLLTGVITSLVVAKDSADLYGALQRLDLLCLVGKSS